MKNFQEQIDQLFYDHGWRVTAGVRNIAKILDSHDIFLGVFEIQKKLNTDNKINISTVYRILEKLEQCRLICHWNRKWKKYRIQIDHHQERHFLICDQCQKAEEIPLEYHSDIVKELAREKNFFLRKVDLNFLGTCEACSQKGRCFRARFGL